MQNSTGATTVDWGSVTKMITAAAAIDRAGTRATAGGAVSIQGNTVRGTVADVVVALPNGMSADFAANSAVPPGGWTRQGVITDAYIVGIAHKSSKGRVRR